MTAFAAYRDRNVPLFVAETLVEAARKHGFSNVTALAPWQGAEVDGVTITANQARDVPGRFHLDEIPIT